MTAPNDPVHAAATRKAMRPHRLFWLGLFLPVNLLFQAICFAYYAYRPDLDAAVFFILLFKTAYFLMVLYCVCSLKMVWGSAAQMSSRAGAWSYRIMGLATLAALLAFHGEHAYQFGRAEREIRRNMMSVNRTLPLAPQAGVRTDQVVLEGRNWVYRLTMTQLQAGQIDRAGFSAAVRGALSGTICALEWHRRLLGLGVRIHYVYRDRSGNVIADEAFGADTCAGKV